MKTNENTKFTERIIDALRKSALELEKFQLKVALGTSEAKDSYEELKKKLALILHDAKYKIKTGKEKVDEVHALLDNLRVQLNLGKVETVEAFNEQKRELLKAIHELEVKLRSNERLQKMYAIALIDLEIFKVQLEIVETKLSEQFVDTEKSLKKSKKKVLNLIEKFKKKYGKNKETKWEHFQREVSEAFDHLKAAFH